MSAVQRFELNSLCGVLDVYILCWSLFKQRQHLCLDNTSKPTKQAPDHYTEKLEPILPLVLI